MPGRLSPQEIATEISVNKLISTSAKLINLILDPSKRPVIRRKDAIRFFNTVDEVCESEIRVLKESLK